MTSLPESLRDAVRGLYAPLIELRHTLHACPETAFEENRTAEHIAGWLEQHGVAFTRGHARGTGIVGCIEGAAGGPTVALRADMDALDIREETGLPYASTNDGRMHACGHDGHVTILCGAAAALAAHRDHLRGTVRLIFQPAEEGNAGGRHVVEEGLLAGVDAAFALHNWPTHPVGTMAVADGVAMASADVFNITVSGRGGHAADPAPGVDPILAAAHVVTALQSIVARDLDPWDAGVVSVTRFHGGTASNIIPDTVELQGTFRALRPETRDLLRGRIEAVSTHTAAAFGAGTEVRFGSAGYPPLCNDARMSAFARDVARDCFGAEAVVPVPHPHMTAEDFAFYLEAVPGAFLFLGNGRADGGPSPGLHTATYDFNDAAIPLGVTWMASLALRFADGTD